MGRKIFGIPPEQYNLNMRTMLRSMADMRGVFKGHMLNKLDEDKLWKLAEKFEWIPDNFPYSIKEDSLMSRAAQVTPFSHAFMFHDIGEKYGALWFLSALMRGTKLKNAAGETFSAWDAYEIVDGELVWTKGKRGVVELSPGNEKELSELDSFEIKNLKRQYEKLQGSYRREERTALESTVMGEFFFQFKKYFYQYLKQWWANPYRDPTVGRYVEAKDINRPDGIPTYQWEAEIMQGRIWVMTDAVVHGRAA